MPVATTKSDKLSQENRPNISPISRKFQHKPSIKVNQSDTSSTSTVSGNNLQPNTKSKVTKKSSTCPHCGVAYAFRSGLAKHVRKAHSNEGQKEAKGYITCHLCRSRWVLPIECDTYVYMFVFFIQPFENIGPYCSSTISSWLSSWGWTTTFSGYHRVLVMESRWREKNAFGICPRMCPKDLRYN